MGSDGRLSPTSATSGLSPLVAPKAELDWLHVALADAGFSCDYQVAYRPSGRTVSDCTSRRLGEQEATRRGEGWKILERLVALRVEGMPDGSPAGSATDLPSGSTLLVDGLRERPSTVDSGSVSPEGRRLK